MRFWMLSLMRSNCIIIKTKNQKRLRPQKQNKNQKRLRPQKQNKNQKIKKTKKLFLLMCVCRGCKIRVFFITGFSFSYRFLV